MPEGNQHRRHCIDAQGLPQSQVLKSQRPRPLIISYRKKPLFVHWCGERLFRFDGLREATRDRKHHTHHTLFDRSADVFHDVESRAFFPHVVGYSVGSFSLRHPVSRNDCDGKFYAWE
jgi:hypothetical protein